MKNLFDFLKKDNSEMLADAEVHRGRMAVCEYVSAALILMRKQEIPLPEPDQFVAWMETLIVDPVKYEKAFQTPFFFRTKPEPAYAQGFNDAADYLWRYAVSLTEDGRDRFDWLAVEACILHMTHHFNVQELPPVEVATPRPVPGVEALGEDDGGFCIETYMEEEFYGVEEEEMVVEEEEAVVEEEVLV